MGCSPSRTSSLYKLMFVKKHEGARKGTNYMKSESQVNSIYDLTETLRRQKAIDTAKAWEKLSRRIVCLSLRRIICIAAVILLALCLLCQFIIQSMLNTTPIEFISLKSTPGIVKKNTPR